VTVDGMAHIASASQASQMAISSQLQLAVVRQHLAAQRQQGEAILALLEAAVASSKEAGLGEAFDGTA
jgi:hypothetical protein